MMGERRIVPQVPQKRRAPALYELISRTPRPETPGTARPGASAAGRVPGEPAERPVRTEPPLRPVPFEGEDRVLGLSPGRVLRVPIGYVFIGVAVMLLALLGAYGLGHHLGEGEISKAREQWAQNETRQIIDPTLGEQTLAASNTVRQPAPDPAPRAVDVPATTRGANVPVPGDPASGSDVSSAGAARLTIAEKPGEDPRRSGLNYAIVARLPLREARASGAFLAAHGIATVMIPDTRDSRLWQVIPTTGFEGNKYHSTPEGKAFDKSIRDLGKVFKREQKGATDFSDLYWQLKS